MQIKEYRIPVPLLAKEYQIAQLYSVSETSKASTTDGEGVEVLTNEPYENEFGKGQYTKKIYHLSHKVPTMIRMLAPDGSLEIHEESWNAFPYCKTVMTNPYMRNKFSIEIISRYVDNDSGKIENVHNLSMYELRKRQIVFIDIANDPIDPKEYTEAEDPAKFRSQITGRGPLGPDWISNTDPLMTCYKAVRCEFKWLGLQGTVETMIQRAMHSVFSKFNRQAFCWIDKWFNLSLSDIRSMEEQTQAELSEKLRRRSVTASVNTNQDDDKTQSTLQ